MSGVVRLDIRTKVLLVLAATFVTCLVVGDILGGKLVQGAVFGHVFTLTVGMIPFPVTFLLTDLLNEFYGRRAARTVTLIAFVMAVLTYAFIYVAAALPFAPFTFGADWKGVNEASFANVFLGSQRMIIASLTAFLVAQFVDIAIFHALKQRTSGKMLWLRATGSTVVSQLVDTAVINVIAWAGLMSFDQMVNVMISSYIAKVGIALALTPALYGGHAVVERSLGLRPVVIGADGEAIEAPIEAPAST